LRLLENRYTLPATISDMDHKSEVVLIIDIPPACCYNANSTATYS
jgi:hypothetical protein